MSANSNSGLQNLMSQLLRFAALYHSGSPGALTAPADFLTHPGPAQSGFLRGGDNRRHLCSERAPYQHTTTEVDARDLWSDSETLRRRGPLCLLPLSQLPLHAGWGRGVPLLSSTEEHSVSLEVLRGLAMVRRQAGTSLAEGVTSLTSGQAGSPSLRDGFSASTMEQAQRGPSADRGALPRSQKRANAAGAPGPEGLSSSCVLVTHAHGHLQASLFLISLTGP